MGGLFALLILLSVALLWRAGTRAREQVILACQRVCSELGLQFLDETVVLRAMRPTRNRSGRMSFQRRYDFEFSASGQERCSGSAVAIGESVERITLDHPEGRLILSGKAQVSYSLLDRVGGERRASPHDRERAG